MIDDASSKAFGEGSISQPPPRELGASGASTNAERAKFELGTPPARFDGLELPWSYGRDRITALVRSPDALYVYWEITDEGIASARKRLGPAGEHGWCTLRVYDTTGRDFDGVNANDYFDVRVDRAERDYFLSLHRPTASFHVEIGIKTHEGYFQAIARSGRADMPRKGPSDDRSLAWMTVTSEDAHPAARPYASKYTGPSGTWQGEALAASSQAPSHPGESPLGHERVESRSFTWTHPAHVDVRWEGPWLFDGWRTEWRLRWVGSAGGRAVLPIDSAKWVVGPFPIHLLSGHRIDVDFIGDGEVLLEEHASGLEVFGPWEVRIHGFQSESERRVLGTWRVHWVRVEPKKVERWWSAFERKRVNVWQRTRLVGGASEAYALVEGGASEMWRLGASEQWSVGASESLAFGGSEMAWLGSSALLFGGASALLYGGASVTTWGGASERSFLGASETHPFGASERFGAGGPAGAREAYAPWTMHDPKEVL